MRIHWRNYFMFFNEDFLNQIRERQTLSEIISNKVSLKKHGREFTGLCPFHSEKTPSFTVNDDKGFYHCFGCGAHGDIFTFTIEMDNLDFIDAVSKLAENVGLSLPEEDIGRKNSSQNISGALTQAMHWFQEQLCNNNIAQRYLKDRNINVDMIKEFKIGYAPKYGLNQHLKQQGIKQEHIIDAGLASRNPKGMYDYFRDRIMFPIFNKRGSIIAYGGRSIGMGTPKYLNSPENILFSKKGTLYGANFVQKHTNDQVILVEGYLDVISLYQYKIVNSVSPMGTAISVEHIQALWKMADSPILCFDGDAAGYKAVLRAIELCIPILTSSKNIRFAILHNKQDPQSILNKPNGKQEMDEALTNTRSVSDVIWSYLYKQVKPTTPEQYALLQEKCLTHIKPMTDKTLYFYYRNFFQQKLKSLYQSEVNNNSNQYKRNMATINNSEASQSNLSTEQLKQSENTLKTRQTTFSEMKQNAYKAKVLLIIIITFPELLDEANIEEEFINFEIQDQRINDARNKVLTTKCLDKLTTSYLNIDNLSVTADQDIRIALTSIDKARALWKRIIDITNYDHFKKEAKEKISNISLGKEYLEQIKYINNENMEDNVYRNGNKLLGQTVEKRYVQEAKRIDDGLKKEAGD